MRKIGLIAAVAAAALPAVALADGAGSPAQRCKAQRTAMGVTAFKDLYGTNRNKSNAFGKCVSKLARADAKNLANAQGNAAKACRAEQNDPNFAASHGGKTFAQFYGTNRNGANAYGKCVSTKAKALAETKSAAQQQSALNTIANASRRCRAERAADPAAFKQKYGTNRNKSNAFGKCVSAKAKAKHLGP